jgi:hypothetical protein
MSTGLVELPCATLHDPWASLCVAGIKTLETRVGSLLSGFTGVLVIHRSLKPAVPYDLSRWGVSLPARPEGWPEDDRGMALGVVYVTRTARHRPSAGPITEFQQRAACFDDLTGRYLSELGRAAWLKAPVPGTGKQGRWKISIPRAYLPEWAATP